MKFIQKKQEPGSLAQLRATPGVAYTGPNADWQAQLLEEQGHLCAYCMNRISPDRDPDNTYKPKMEIEHILPRERFRDQELVWRNMVAVCNGNTGVRPHCDKAVGQYNASGVFIAGKSNGQVELAFINPCKKHRSEDVVKYKLDGRIESVNGNSAIEEDINERLNLNDSRLIEFRKNVLDLTIERLKRHYGDRNRWNQRVFDTEIQHWNTKKDQRNHPFCMTAIWLLNWFKQKPKYR